MARIGGAKPQASARVVLVQRLLERGGGRELRSLARGDLNRLPRRRVAALAGGTLAYAELAEARDSDFAPSGELAGDRIKGGVHGALRVRTAETGVRSHLLCKLLLGH